MKQSTNFLAKPSAKNKVIEPENTLQFTVGHCFLGNILVAQSNKGICAIFLGDDAEALITALQSRLPNFGIIELDNEVESVMDRVMAMVENPSQRSDFTLDIQGTLFQQKVWQALQSIPTGQTTSYAAIAKQIGNPKAVRAVAAACAANKIAVVIPCHRVVRSDGGLSGYRWGIERKAALLKREQQS